MEERERVEGGRRARAAMAYSGKSGRDLAAALNVSEATLGRILSGQRRETSWEDLWTIADACTLPREWFTADFYHLDELVPPGLPRFARRPELRAAMERVLEDRVRQARRRKPVAGSSKRGRQKKAPGS